MTQVDAWTALESPLSATEIRRLWWLQIKMTAVMHLANIEQEQPVSFQHAKRLAFQRWRYLTGRLSEAAA